MGVIRTSANTSFREDVTEGLPSSGDHNPIKSEIRATFGVVEDQVAAVEAIATTGVIWTTNVVRVRSTANVAIASGLVNGAVLNGVTLATGDYVFLPYQTAPAENGLYTVVASGAAARATFADTAAELAKIGFVLMEGTAGAGERWTLPLAAASITLGTTALTFSRIGVEVSYATQINARLDRFPEVFTAASTDEYAKTLFREISIEYGEPGHVYYMNYRTHFDGATYKIWLQLENLTRGQTVAVLERQGASAAAVKAKFAEGYAYLTLVSLGNPLPTPTYAAYVGTAALVKMDLDAIDWTKSQTAYVAATATGIRAENVHAPSEMLADWLKGPRPEVVLTVGATGCNYTTVRAAVESLYDPDLAGSIVSSSWPISNLVSWSRQVLVHVVDAGYSENLAGLILPHFVIVRGQGKGNTVLTATGAAGDLPRVFEANHSFRFEHMTIRQNGAGYAVHHDILNALTKRAINNPKVQLYRIWQVYFDVRVEAYSGNLSPMLGVGFSNGHWLYCEATDFIRDGSAATEMVYVHNSPDNTEPGVLWFKNCRSNDAAIVGSNGFLILGTTQAIGTSARHSVIIENTQAGKVGRTNTSGGGESFVRQGLWTGMTYPVQLDPA